MHVLGLHVETSRREETVTLDATIVLTRSECTGREGMEESNRGQQYECQVDAGTRFIERVAAELESRRRHLWKNASPHYKPRSVRISEPWRQCRGWPFLRLHLTR